MFTGLTEEIGKVKSVLASAGGIEITVKSAGLAQDSNEGDSISVNGVCLTAARVLPDAFIFQAVRATIDKTSLGRLKAGEAVNLERAIKAGDRFGGHFVTGHVDATAQIQSSPAGWLSIKIPREIESYLFPSASIAVDGVSLTVQKVGHGRFQAAIIPHTAGKTTLGAVKPGRIVNIEVDIISKQVVSLLKKQNARGLR